jgi:uncharacterized DUF497 family protein
MKILWDEQRRLANIHEHDVDFARVGARYFSAALVRRSRCGAWAVMGWVDGFVAVIMMTCSDESVTIVSARAATCDERKLFE